MGHCSRTYLAGESVLVCRSCNNHLAVGESVLSKVNMVEHFLFDMRDAEDRDMRTGKHTVRDVYCEVCNTVIGWKYDYAYEPDQKYKEGRFILERELIMEKPENRGAFAGRLIIEEHPRDLQVRV